MKKNGLLLSILVLSPLSFALANTTDISIVNDAATLSQGGNKKLLLFWKKINQVYHILNMIDSMSAAKV